MSDARIIVETGAEAKVASIIEPEIEDLGYRLVRVKLSNINGATLQIMAERPDGSMNVAGCEEVSRAISPILDIEDPISQAYHLEISSPGIDRPLVRLSDFVTWTGHSAKLETHQIIDGRKRYKGMIMSVKGNEITFQREAPNENEGPNFVLPIGEIKDAKLVMTDGLITEALKRDKTLREANEVEDGDEPSSTEN